MVKGLALIIIFLVMTCLYGQTSAHQRIGVEPDDTLELSLEAGYSLQHQSRAGLDVFMLQGDLAAELLLRRSWFAAIQLPLVGRLVIGRDANRFNQLGIGDIGLQAGWLSRVGDTRTNLGLSLSLPTGVWQPYAEQEGWLLTGSGRWQVGIQGGLGWIIDPVVLGLVLAYEVGLPRVELVGNSWQPGRLHLGLSVTEVLNTKAGYSLKLGQQIVLPAIQGNAWHPDDFYYTASLAFQLWLTINNGSWRLGLAKNLTELAGPATVSLSYRHTFKSGSHDG